MNEDGSLSELERIVINGSLKFANLMITNPTEIGLEAQTDRPFVNIKIQPDFCISVLVQDNYKCGTRGKVPLIYGFVQVMKGSSGAEVVIHQGGKYSVQFREYLISETKEIISSDAHRWIRDVVAEGVAKYPDALELKTHP